MGEKMILVIHPQSQDIRSETFYLNESQLVPTVTYEEIPWLWPAFRQLHALQSEGRDVPGVGDLRISTETSNLVRKLLAQISNRHLPVPGLIPMSGGGVSINWNVRGKTLSFRVFPGDEEVVFVVSDSRDELVTEGVFRISEKTALNAAIEYLGTA